MHYRSTICNVAYGAFYGGGLPLTFSVCSILCRVFYSVKKLRRVLETLWRVSTMFTRPAITPPEVNGFGWNLGNSEYILPGASPDSFGRDPRRTESGRASRNFVFCPLNNARLYRFSVSLISRNVHTRLGSERWWIHSENICENLPVRGLFPKRSCFAWTSSTTSDFSCDICEMITNLGKSRLVGAPMECWLSICTVGINSKSFPWPAGCVQETTFLDIAGSSV